MPKYLCQGSYTEHGLKGLVKEGGSKRQAVVVLENNRRRNLLVDDLLEDIVFKHG